MKVHWFHNLKLSAMALLLVASLLAPGATLPDRSPGTSDMAANRLTKESPPAGRSVAGSR